MRRYTPVRTNNTTNTTAATAAAAAAPPPPPPPDEMYALLDVGRLTRETELIRELDVIDAAIPPSPQEEEEEEEEEMNDAVTAQLLFMMPLFFSHARAIRTLKTGHFSAFPAIWHPLVRCCLA